MAPCFSHYPAGPLAATTNKQRSFFGQVRAIYEHGACANIGATLSTVYFFIICRRGGHYLGRHRISYLVSATHRPKAERIFQLFFSCFFFACQRVGYSNGILQIDSSSSLSKNSAGSSSSSTSGSSQILRVSPQTLVYLESSPDFCLVNSTAGQCSPSSSMFVSDEVVPCRRYRRYSVAILMTELVVFFAGWSSL